MPHKVLVVDDEPDLASLVRQRFRQQIRSGEWEFTFAQNGFEALAALEADPAIGVVMSDINMPQMDGLTLLSRLAEQDRVVKSVVVSAYDDMQNIRTAMNRGAFDFLTKPINFQDFETTLRKTLREFELLQQVSRDRAVLAALQYELAIATRIQQSLLPTRLPPHPEVALAASMVPARHVGGDLYDYFWLDEHRLGFIIGDVSGKGVPAALLMAVSCTLLRATTAQVGSPSECLAYLNHILSRQPNDEGTFVTIFYGILDIRTGVMQYCNGAHNSPYLYRAGAFPRALPTIGGMMVGLLEFATYEMAEVTLEPGDGLLLFTDGIPDAEDAAGKLFTEERLCNALQAALPATPDQLVEKLFAEVREHIGTTPQGDDLTLFAVQYREAAQ